MDGDTALSKIGGVTLKRSVSDVERRLREEATAAFRVGAHLGWNLDTLNHITVRIPGTETFLMNPVGLAWREITPDSLVTVTFEREVVSHSGIKLAAAGYNFHSGILKTRPDLGCVIHTHAFAGMVISSLQEPLQIFDQSGCLLYGEVGYHDFEGLADQPDEVPRILRDMGRGHALIMRNHGLLSVGANVAEAFCWMRLLADACSLHERVAATGRPMRPVSEEIQRSTKAYMGSGNKPQEDWSWDYFLRLSKELQQASRP